MALNNGEYSYSLVDRSEIKDFIEAHHYSKSINGVMANYCFAMYHKETLIGAMLYGKLGMANAWKKYADDPEKVIELRRLVLIDETPKNAESWFIGKTLRWLKNNTKIETVVSYADPNYGHSGIIYQATNFDLVGKTAKGKVIFWNGKKYHDKAIRTKYKGRLKPFAQKLKDALQNGQAEYVVQEPKNIYVKKIKLANVAQRK